MKKDERITIEDSILKITNELLQEWEERFQNISIRNDIPFVNRSHDEFDYFSEIEVNYWYENGSLATMFSIIIFMEGKQVLSVDEAENYIREEMADYILNNLHGMTFPGWEPERMEKLDELFAAYKPVTKEVLWENLKYFLEALMPTCKECDIKMAIHMDDPPWDIFGLPRLLTCEENIDRFLKMVDSPYNCLTLCSGSLNADPRNNVADIVRKHCDRIAFAHIRNVKHFPNGDFSEASHRDCDGDTRILDILKAYHDCGFEGYIRPDHGRHLWDEKPGNVRPGYGLYDRALGIMYMLGVWDMLDKLDGNK